MAGFIRVLRDIALLIVRVAFGLLLVLRGWQRWMGEGGMQAQIDYLAQFHTPQPEIMAWGSVILEILGGIFLIFGMLTPLVALAFTVEFIMIIAWTRWFNGPFLTKGGYEYLGVQAGLSLLLTVFGAGRAGLDNLFKRSDDSDDDYEPTPRATGSTVVDSDPA